MSRICTAFFVSDRTGITAEMLGHSLLTQFDDVKFTEITVRRDTINRLQAVLTLFLVQPLEYSIVLLLEPGSVQPATLGDADSAMLGNNCWLSHTSNTEIGRIELPASGLTQ